MTSKKPSLAAALHEMSGKKPSIQPVATSAQPTAAMPAMPKAEQGKPPSRIGKRTIAGHFDPAVTRQLKQLALDQDANVQQLLSEALNDLFTKHSLKPIA